MTITTRESINYQFSLIYGYSSPNDDLTVGDVIGPGKLTRKMVNELSISVLKFLRMYNAVLRDYTGAELFSIEFGLFNYDEKDAQTKIYPKSMFLIPGKYKDCESLFLALRPETGYLDTHLSRRSINEINKLFFEVEEYTNRPELKKEEKRAVLKKFAGRFSQKLYGQLIEDKWNKKLIGISSSLPTEKEMLNTYETIGADFEIQWYKRPSEIQLLEPKFMKIETPFKTNIATEHLKYSISEPSAFFIIENTLKLGTNLINLASTGTIDEGLDKIIYYVIEKISEKLRKEEKELETAELISNIGGMLNGLEALLNTFLEYSDEFLKSGEIGNLSYIRTKYQEFIEKKGQLEGEDYSSICKLTVDTINQSVLKKDELRAIDLESTFNYFREITKIGFYLVKSSLPKYLARRRLKTLIKEFLDRLYKIISKEQKPAKVLGNRILEQFEEYLYNQIEINPLLLKKEIEFDESTLIKEFKKIITANLDKFFDSIELKIGDLISFAEIMMEFDHDNISPHINKFKSFTNELNFLLSYILRYSTITRYIKEESDEEISDPVTFANRFHRFLEKRVGGINLEWKTYILDWIKDYAKKFFKLEEKRQWTLKEVYDDFINYLEERNRKERKTEHFLDFLDGNIAKVKNEGEKKGLLEFFRQYELSLDIKTEFPKYIKSKIANEITNSSFQLQKLKPIEFLSLNEEDTFYKYILEMELKYFSKLIPRPLTLILKHNLTNEEKEQFKGDLFHVFNFRFWHDNLKTKISDNFKEVYREWIREL